LKLRSFAFLASLLERGSPYISNRELKQLKEELRRKKRLSAD